MASWPGEGEHGLEDQDGGGLGLPAVARIGEGRAPCWIPLLPGLLDPLRVTRRWCRGGGDREGRGGTAVATEEVGGGRVLSSLVFFRVV